MNKKLLPIIIVAVGVVVALVLTISLGAFNKAPQDSGGAQSSAGESGGETALFDGQVEYSAKQISKFGSGTPYGTVNYDEECDTAVIWNMDASLDNYGGIQTPVMALDFSKAVVFRMNVVSCFSQYIVKLAVEGESEYYYVLSDEGKTGEISVNVVDSMLCNKYREKNTQHDPGYRSGWKYTGQTKNCTFHILAKGPDGEQQTAELVVTKIAVFNDETAVLGVQIDSPVISAGKITARRSTQPVDLSATITPTEIKDKSVIWETLDPSVARVDENGRLSFVGVGKTSVVATSRTDQSKSAYVEVNVLSGYENTTDLKQALSSLAYNGSTADSDVFNDVFLTSWDSENAMTQTFTSSSYKSATVRISGQKTYIHNYFDANDAAKLSEANSLSSGGTAYFTLNAQSASGATVYSCVDGKLYKETCNGTLKLEYAKNNGGWQKTPSYVKKTIFVYPDGSVKKAEIETVACKDLALYSASDFADTSKWTVPDKSKLKEDAVINALSPASVRTENNVAVIKQNKYDGAKYCFGGLVSKIFTASKTSPVEIEIDVAELNQKNEFVKTMWEIKIIYYEGNDVVNANPLKIDGNNKAGKHTVTFTPKYDSFRIYLVVNGSDIGEQFADAQMKIGSLNVYSLGD